MKRTELERKERDLKKQEKKIIKTGSGAKGSVNDYIDRLFALLRYDDTNLFNTTDDMNILELFESMKEEIPENQWDNIIKKAIRKTKITEREKAIAVLNEILNF